MPLDITLSAFGLAVAIAGTYREFREKGVQGQQKLLWILLATTCALLLLGCLVEVRENSRTAEKVFLFLQENPNKSTEQIFSNMKPEKSRVSISRALDQLLDNGRIKTERRNFNVPGDDPIPVVLYFVEKN